MELEKLRHRRWLTALMLALSLGGFAACEGEVEGGGEIQENGGDDEGNEGGGEGDVENEIEVDTGEEDE